MDYTDTEQELLKRWQCLQRRSGDASTLTPFQRADCARQLAELPRYAAALKVASLRDLEPITKRLADRYVLPDILFTIETIHSHMLPCCQIFCRVASRHNYRSALSV